MSGGDAVQAVVLVAALGGALVWLVWLRRATRRGGEAFAEEPPSSGRALTLRRPAVVANPTKIFDMDDEIAWVTRRCEALAWGRPIWLETRADDPGHGQTRAALAQKAETVLAYGGDGTVRAVVSELAGTSVPLGILPAGTGNLLARNLALPVTDLDAALDIALGHRQRLVDVGRAEIDISGEDDAPSASTFAVMAGIGFDAEVMATVEPQLKERVGWFAYVLAGLRRMTGARTRVTLWLDDDPPLHRSVRSVIVGNCGELTGGLRLMPDAVIDDGWLDVAVFAPRGVVGWGAVVGTVMTRSRFGHPVIQHFRCRSVEIRAEQPLHVQLDGDPAGTARVLRARVDPLALTVRCG